MFHGSPPLRAPKLDDGAIRTSAQQRTGAKVVGRRRISPLSCSARGRGLLEESMSIQEIPGSTGLAVPLKGGQAIRLVNTFGSQVVDTWAIAAADTSEYLSVEHTRRMLYNLFPKRGDVFYSNRRSKMLLLEEDTSPGRHDMLFA